MSSGLRWSASASTSGWPPPSTCTAACCADATSSTSPRTRCCPGASPPPSRAESRPIRGRGVTIKHLACNNQETNRLNSNSNVSPRALRDLYLRAFEICVRQARPAAVMTSYNLINGVHTSESTELLEVILRQEWGFDGLVMTDWVVDGMTRSDMKHPRTTAATTVKAGNELFMPGGEPDRKNLLAALRRGSEGGGNGSDCDTEPDDDAVSLTRAELEKQAARVIRAVWSLAGSGRSAAHR